VFAVLLVLLWLLAILVDPVMGLAFVVLFGLAALLQHA
jgi:hypothetical protein